MEMTFKELPNGMFRFRGIVYTKINETQGVQITTGRIVEFNPDDPVEKF